MTSSLVQLNKEKWQLKCLIEPGIALLEAKDKIQGDGIMKGTVLVELCVFGTKKLLSVCQDRSGTHLNQSQGDLVRAMGSSYTRCLHEEFEALPLH